MRRWLGSASLNVCLNIRNIGGGVVRNLFTAQNCAFQNFLLLKKGNNHPFPLKPTKLHYMEKGFSSLGWFFLLLHFYFEEERNNLPSMAWGSTRWNWFAARYSYQGLEKSALVGVLKHLHILMPMI